MKKYATVLPAVFFALSLSLALDSCVVSRPVRPGPHFVWVPAYSTQGGVLLRGHWIYKGPAYRDKEWVPGHYDRSGRWIEGRWHKIRTPGKDAIRVPGHRAPNGRWVPGHWR